MRRGRLGGPADRTHVDGSPWTSLSLQLGPDTLLE